MLYHFVLLSIFLCSSIGSFSLFAVEEAPTIKTQTSQDTLKALSEKIKEATTLNNKIKEIDEKLTTSTMSLEELSELTNQKQELINQQEKVLDQSRGFMGQLIEEEVSEKEHSSSPFYLQALSVSAHILWFLVKTPFYCLQTLNASSKMMWFLAKTPIYCLRKKFRVFNLSFEACRFLLKTSFWCAQELFFHQLAHVLI